MAAYINCAQYSCYALVGLSSKQKQETHPVPQGGRETMTMTGGGVAGLHHIYIYIYIHTLHYITLRYVTLPYLTLHYITLHTQIELEHVYILHLCICNYIYKIHRIYTSPLPIYSQKTNKYPSPVGFPVGHLSSRRLTDFSLRGQDIEAPSWEDDHHQADRPGW